MPFKSEKQRKYMFAKHPKIARRWAKEEGRPRPKRNRDRSLRDKRTAAHRFLGRIEL